ncbi:MAG: hydroxysqualene dehydroxylase HpnE [Proteobacteria bacterium]|nr:hydroxysqualene dehydroxylase HpnE [Pseudomonadota bacterium]
MNSTSNPSSRPAVHVIGAGVAGLAAAIRASANGAAVHHYEATRQAGGRCRSFFDETLDRVIDNGNHLILGGNRGVFDYLRDIGAPETLTPLEARFSFADLTTGEQWQIQPSAGRIPFWIFQSTKRIPGTSALDYLRAASLGRAAPGATIADCVNTETPMFERFWQPISRAVLNTDAHEGSASLLWPMITETLLKGADASRPYLAQDGLSTALVDPALEHLRHRGIETQFGRRLRELGITGDRVTRLNFGEYQVTVPPADRIVLALPPREAANLCPGLTVPTEMRSIVNLHFRLEGDAVLPNGAAFTGLIGTTAQWLFARGDILSVTISDAGSFADRDADEIAAMIWLEIRGLLGLSAAEIPPVRVIKEHRATIAQTPSQVGLRPESTTGSTNLFLAGDWIDTGLPASIDGALRSGYRAADLAFPP